MEDGIQTEYLIRRDKYMLLFYHIVSLRTNINYANYKKNIL